MQRLSILISALGFFVSATLATEPAARREYAEWCSIWVSDATKTDLPRVLLIGDSICNNYRVKVEQELKGKASVAMLATSAALGNPELLDEVKILVKNYKFAVIHFNIGLHGWDYSEAEYKRLFPEFLKVLKENAPNAKLIWATSTPIRSGPPNFQQFDAKNERVKARNTIVVGLAAQEGIPVDDLYGLVENHPEWISDGIHYKPEGTNVQGEQVAKHILDALAK